MADQFMLHIRNASPGDLAVALTTLRDCPDLSTISEIVEQAEELGFLIRDRQRLEALATARDLGLVHQEKNVLSDTGEVVAQLGHHKPELFVDVVHGLMYALWDSRQRGENCFSWSYRALCKMLWKTGDGDLANRRVLASEIEAQARTAFSRRDLVFSPKSIGGAFLWLSELVPPVLSEKEIRFSRRTFCAPELLVLAIDFAYRTLEIDYGVNLLLNDETREGLCQVCLLAPERLDRVLDYTMAQFDYLNKGIGGGWGQYLNLERAPRMEEFI